MGVAKWPTVDEMLALSDEQLRLVDPVAMNLIVAKGIPSLADLDIGHYVTLADLWGDDLRNRVPTLEREFRQAPQDWRNDLAYFRLGLVCWYMEVVLGISYREDQRDKRRIRYTDPSDLFLNGVMDSRRGTCATQATLNVAIGRRIGLPVSLATVGWHFICRYDDGLVRHNIEATETGRGGFSSQTDEFILNKHALPPLAQQCRSDLRAVTPREMLGLFVGLRARHLENIDRIAEAEPDYLLARYLFPGNRQLYVAQNQVSVQSSMNLFEPHEKGHPAELACWLQDVVRAAPWKRTGAAHQPKEKPNASHIDAFFESVVSY